DLARVGRARRAREHEGADAAGADDRRVPRDVELDVRLPADGDAPRGAALEQLVGVDLVGPAEEVRLGVVLRGAVDGRPFRGRLRLGAARELFGAPLRLLGGRTFHVAARHAVQHRL